MTLFRFDASSTNLPTNDVWRIKVRWDFDNDGIWDTDFSLDKTATHRFKSSGTKIVTLEALDITGSSDIVKGIVQVMELVKDSIIVDSRDNHSYSVIKINHTWWMTQDLAYGQIISNLTSPSDNRITERWIYPDSMSGSNLKQGFYTEMEATEYGRKEEQGICPEGWRMPIVQDCSLLNSFFWNDWQEIVSKDSIKYQFNRVNNGYFYQNTKRFNSVGHSNYYWINDNVLGYTYAVFGFSGLEPAHWNSFLEDMWKEILGENFNRSFFGFAIRCVRTE